VIILFYKPPKAESTFKLKSKAKTSKNKPHIIAQKPGIKSEPQTAKKLEPQSGKKSTVQQSVLPPLEIPEGIKTIWINVGTHLDPVLPPENDKSVLVIGFEPNLDLVNRISKTARLFIIPAAVGNFDGIASFHLSSNDGGSSSLAQFQDRAKKLDSGNRAFVPVVRLEHILTQIPSNINVDKIKIDAQGFDLEVIKSAGPQISRFKEIIGEVVANEDLAYYKDVDNSKKSWLEFMEANGFKKVHEECNGVSDAEIARGVRCEEANLTFQKK
jgi:FkbM family methyltransferase